MSHPKAPPINPFKDRFGKSTDIISGVLSGTVSPATISKTIQRVSASGGMDTKNIDSYRQGIENLTSKHLYGSTLPKITGGHLPEDSDVVVHTIDRTQYGQSKLHEDNTPFIDIIGRINAVTYIDSSDEAQYPVILFNPSYR